MIASPLARSLAAAAGLFAAAMSSSAWAQVDRPISGRVLKLKRTEDATSFRFVSKDPALPFPAIGSADDPAAGSPGGIIVELFTPTQGYHYAAASAGFGDPGWKADTSGMDSYLYRNSARNAVQIIRKVSFVEGKLLRINATMYFSLSGPLGRAAVRVRTGSLRSCALFDGTSVQRDGESRFVAMDAAAPALADCSDETGARARCRLCSRGMAQLRCDLSRWRGVHTRGDRRSLSVRLSDPAVRDDGSALQRRMSRRRAVLYDGRLHPRSRGFVRVWTDRRAAVRGIGAILRLRGLPGRARMWNRPEGGHLRQLLQLHEPLASPLRSRRRYG